MGLASVSVQTAAGSASPEATIEGILAADELRDFLYAKMRGVREHAAEAVATPADTAAADGEPIELLREIRDALVAIARRQEANS
jgi:putative membrane protein